LSGATCEAPGDGGPRHGLARRRRLWFYPGCHLGCAALADPCALIAGAGIAGRTVHIGSCGGGGRTYHAWLEGERSVVSAYSIGDRRLGEQAMGALRGP